MLRVKLLPSFQDLVVNSDLTEVVDEAEFLPSNSGIMLGGFFCNLKNMEQQSSPSSSQTLSLFENYLSASIEDLYSCDDFRMFEFKVRRCMRGRSHDWTECPFAHAGEKARRRDPRRFHYSGSACADFRKGICEKGDACEFAHGVFECWLHPSRYRTQLCKDGRNCRRRVCFFAHTPEQLRLMQSFDGNSSMQTLGDGRLCQGLLDGSCYRHGGSSPFKASALSPFNCANHTSVCCVSSPTSTLVGLLSESPPSLSPPLSPTKSLPPSPEDWHHPFLLAQNTNSVAMAPIASVQRQQTDSLMPTGVIPLNLAQMRLQQAFAASPSPCPTPQPMTDLATALQQMELQGENSIWIQNQATTQPPQMPICSRPSPLWRSTLNPKFSTPFGDDKVGARWGTEVIEDDELINLPRVESGRELRTKIYGKLKTDRLEIADNLDLGWVNDLVE